MNLSHRKPLNNLVSVDEWIDRFMGDDFFGEGWSNRGVAQESFPVTDIFETKDEYVFKVEVPGLEKKDIHVELEDNTLIVKGEYNKENKTEEGSYHRTERFRGTFKRSFRLPGEADGNKVKAEMKNGVLELKVAKAEAKKAKSIPITVN
jgi:HSP20 family protein